VKKQHVAKSHAKKREQESAEPQKTNSKQDLKDDLDDMLDEIDEVLETNAAEFVAGYVQKGGQ